MLPDWLVLESHTPDTAVSPIFLQNCLGMYLSSALCCSMCPCRCHGSFDLASQQGVQVSQPGGREPVDAQHTSYDRQITVNVIQGQ